MFSLNYANQVNAQDCVTTPSRISFCRDILKAFLDETSRFHERVRPSIFSSFLMSFCPFICMSLRPHIWSSFIHVFFRPYCCPFITLPVHIAARPYRCLSILLSVHIPVCPFCCPSLCCPSLCPFFRRYIFHMFFTTLLKKLLWAVFRHADDA